MVFLKISRNSQENTCARVSFFNKKETLAQMLSCEFYETFTNTYFIEHLWKTVSAKIKSLNEYLMSVQH